MKPSTLTLWKNSKTSYDEIYLNGESRPEYRRFLSFYQTLSSDHLRETRRSLKKCLENDASIFPVPRILTQKDHQLLLKGIKQRAKAFQLFLKDHYFGQKKYARNNLIPKKIIKQLFSQNFESDCALYLNSENIQFWYAPDIIRDPQGQFRVVEDNVGFVGGLGDLTALSRAAQLQQTKKNGAACKKTSNLLPPAKEFYEQMAELYFQQGQKYGEGKVVVLSYARKHRVNHEDDRLHQILKQSGITVVEMDLSQFAYSASGARLETKNGMVFITHFKNNRPINSERVSFVILNVDTADIEPFHPSTRARFLHTWMTEGLEEGLFSKSVISKLKLIRDSREVMGFGAIQELSKLYVKYNPDCCLSNFRVTGFWNAVQDGNLGVSYAPGMEIINDKHFYAYSEKLIQFYLKEKPLLQTIDTVSLENHLDSVFQHSDDWVIKSVSGRGGSEVWIGNRLTPSQITALKSLVSKNPSRYIAQKFVPLSQLLGAYVDLRPLGIIGSRRTLVSPHFWGRANSSRGQGKVNVSCGGMLTTIMVVPTVLQKTKLKPLTATTA